MIEIYTKAPCRSSRKAVKILQASGVQFKRISVTTINEEEFLNLLKMTENVHDIIVESRVNTNIDDLTLKQLYKTFEQDKYIIRTPLIVYNRKVLHIGYELESLCRFVEREIGYIPDNLKEMMDSQTQTCQNAGKMKKKNFRKKGANRNE